MLLYKHGALNKQVCEWCEMALDKNEFPVLVSAILDNTWINENLKKFPHFGEDCMGNEREIVGGTHMYTQIGVPQGYLYFMHCKEDYEKVCSLPTMIDTNPFQTLLRR